MDPAAALADLRYLAPDPATCVPDLRQRIPLQLLPVPLLVPAPLRRQTLIGNLRFPRRVAPFPSGRYIINIVLGLSPAVHNIIF